jgi:hypothetical protein
MISVLAAQDIKFNTRLPICQCRSPLPARLERAFHAPPPLSYSALRPRNQGERTRPGCRRGRPGRAVPSPWHHEHCQPCRTKFGLNPKSEIEMAGMRQNVGAETLWKNRSHTRSGLVRFFQTVYAQQIDVDRPFLFRISGLSRSQTRAPRRCRDVSARLAEQPPHPTHWMQVPNLAVLTRITA